MPKILLTTVVENKTITALKNDIEFLHATGYEIVVKLTNQNLSDLSNIDLIICEHGSIHIPTQVDKLDRLRKICPKIIFLNRPHIPTGIFFDTEGYCGGSMFAKTMSMEKLNSVSVEDATRSFIKHSIHVDNNRSKYRQPKRTGWKPEHQFLLVIGQKGLDSVRFFSHFTNYYNAMCWALPRLDKLNIPILFKPHPKENIEYDRVIPEMIKNETFKNISIAPDLSVHELIENSLAVITVNSGVGYESLLHLKRVFTLGKSDYNIVTTDIKCDADVLNIPTSLSLTDVECDNIRKFIHLYNSRIIPIDDVLTIKQKIDEAML